MGDEPSSPPKLDFGSELKEAMKRNLELEAKLESSEARNKSKDTQLSELRKKLGAASEPKPEPEPAVVPQPAPAAPPEPEKTKVVEHSMSITDAFCPECGGPNPDFKDETECIECGHPLGAIATLDKVKNCPGCGKSGKIARKKKGSGLNIGEALGIHA
jgi:hypothetical protein